MKKINTKLLLITLSTVAIASVGTVATLSAKNKPFLKKEFALIDSLNQFGILKEGQNIKVSNSIGQEEWVYTLNRDDFTTTSAGVYSINHKSRNITNVLIDNKPNQYFNILVPSNTTTFNLNEEDKVTLFYKKIRYLDLSRADQLRHVYGFSNLPELLNVYFPGYVTSVENNAFENCPKLKEINNLKYNERLTSIGEFAFKGTAISTLFLPDSVKTIGNNAFANMNNLQAQTMNLPNKFNTRDEFVRLGLTTGTGNALDNVNFEGTQFSKVEFNHILIDQLRASTQNIDILAEEFNSKPLSERLRYVKQFSELPPDNILILRDVAFRDVRAKLIALPDGNAKLILDAKLNSLYKTKETTTEIFKSKPIRSTTFSSLVAKQIEGVYKLKWKVSNKNFDDFNKHINSEVNFWNTNSYKDPGFNTGPVLRALELNARSLPDNSKLTLGQLTKVGADKYNFSLSLENVFGRGKPITLTFEINFDPVVTPEKPKPPVAPDGHPDPDNGGNNPAETNQNISSNSAIIGGVIGGVLLISLIALVVIVLIKKKSSTVS